ncbi:MAG: hypothetical protein LBC70_06605 [Chitinispirillales bacterium]|nr:hypothetical protein [Chitinispirillales bacterium]
MLTIAQKFKTVIPAELRELPEVEYLEKETVGWDEEITEIKALLAAGELTPQTSEEFAAEYGIKLQ